MNTDKKKQIPDMMIYGVLFGIVAGVSVWLLVFHNESPTNWILYVLMGAATLAAAVKFAHHSSRKRERTT